jgi:hypothetical protein
VIHALRRCVDGYGSGHFTLPQAVLTPARAVQVLSTAARAAQTPVLDEEAMARKFFVAALEGAPLPSVEPLVDAGRHQQLQRIHRDVAATALTTAVREVERAGRVHADEIIEQHLAPAMHQLEQDLRSDQADLPSLWSRYDAIRDGQTELDQLVGSVRDGGRYAAFANIVNVWPGFSTGLVRTRPPWPLGGGVDFMIWLRSSQAQPVVLTVTERNARATRDAAIAAHV